ncbi:unnamed protein product [Adineta steineri]|uniref:G-protein coupled receptors family 1 profile domain-containing protein n=1 Tax=Adineta steineri TaxID=433720 RepID=A0A814YUK4_9BILA|nr:unnamed protein product [Adineta steineri]CAF3558757.1 unnamed protein product [Adineta steineri]
MNILIFLSVRSYRKTPSTFYFLIISITNIIYILINLISRIVSTGFLIDLTRTSIIWCKARLSLIGVFGLISFTCSSLATIDQFFATSPNVQLRRCSNIKWTYRIVLLTILLCILHAIPCFIYLDISPITKTCLVTNNAYNFYLSLYSLSLISTFPVIIMSIFGYLTYRHINLRRILIRQSADRQITRMTLIQVILVITTITPYGIQITYNLITTGIYKDTDRIIKESFSLTIISLLTYVYFVGTCYTFLISSSRFRRAVKDHICFRRRRAQVAVLIYPIQERIVFRNQVH